MYAEQAAVAGVVEPLSLSEMLRQHQAFVGQQASISGYALYEQMSALAQQQTEMHKQYQELVAAEQQQASARWLQPPLNPRLPRCPNCGSYDLVVTGLPSRREAQVNCQRCLHTLVIPDVVSTRRRFAP